MEWTKERHEAAKVKHTRQGDDGIDAQSTWETLGEALAEIERLTAKVSVCEWQHRPCVDCGAMGTFVGQGLYECWKCTATELKAELDTARAELHACGLELQTCRSTLEEERRDGDVQRTEIERLTVALRHAVDVARDIGAQRDRAFDAANRATDMRPGLTEGEALATAGPLCRDIYNRIGLATGNKIGAPEWMRDAIAAALLRASRGAPAPAPQEALDHAYVPGNKTLDPVTREVFIGCLKCAHRESDHARLTGLTEEQLDVLARAMPDVVDYERATPEQRRSTVLDVLAAHGPRPSVLGASRGEIGPQPAPEERADEAQASDLQARAFIARRAFTSSGLWIAVVRAVDASRPGLTEEEVRPRSRPYIAEQRQRERSQVYVDFEKMGQLESDVIEWLSANYEPLKRRALEASRASRGTPAPGHVSIPRGVLEKLVDATQYEDDVREAREQAKRILQQATLAAEPARTDPEAARQLADARAEHDRLDAKFRSYDGGDRPQSPPASLIRDMRAAEERVRELEAK